MLMTPAATAERISLTVCSMSRVATAVWSAKRRTSRATTAKPTPYLPAFSASMAALSESKLVWSATFVIGGAVGTGAQVLAGFGVAQRDITVEAEEAGRVDVLAARRFAAQGVHDVLFVLFFGVDCHGAQDKEAGGDLKNAFVL